MAAMMKAAAAKAKAKTKSEEGEKGLSLASAALSVASIAGVGGKTVQRANKAAAVATVQADSNKTVILDIRVPSFPVAELAGHANAVNAVAWAPHSSCHVCTAGDDNHALIWDLSAMPSAIEDPILAYDAKHEINNLLWSTTQPDWVSIAFSDKLQILRV